MADVSSINKVRENRSQIDSDDPCNILLTSGTTSKPKAAVQSHFNIVNNGYYCGIRLGLHKKQHTICLQNPLFHTFATIVGLSASINHGATVVLPNDGYDPDKNLTAIAKQQCSIIIGTPTMYVDLVAKQRQRNEDINPEIALSGGSLCTPKLLQDMLDTLKIKTVKNVYGLTETTASAFFSQDDETIQQTLTTVGKLQYHLEAKVVDSEGNKVPFGVPGELLVRGYSVMIGYYEDEQKTKEAIDSTGWFRTGDRFILHEDGYGEVVGRIKDMIIRGGENIYPKEIEELLITHPDIMEVQVVGLPHERLGEEVCAVIKTRNNRAITVEEVFHFCKGKLSNFKIPSIVKVMQQFPTTTSGKVQKHKIIEIFIKNKL